MRFDMSRAWNDATAMIAANREVMLIVAGVFFFLPSLATSLLMPPVESTFSQGAAPSGNFEQALAQLESELQAAFPPDVMLAVVLSALAQAVGFIALIALLRDDSKPTVGEALKTGLIGLLPYIASQLLAGFALALALIVLVAAPAAAGLGIVSAIAMIAALPVMAYVMIKISLVTPVIALEKMTNPIAILNRSWQLTKGNSFRLLGYYVLLTVAFLVISMVIGIVFGLITAMLGSGTAFQLVNGILSGIVGAAATMVFAGVIAAVHRQLAGPSTGNLEDTFG
ncbi:hypothetical protein SZ64_16430 [Erythrobacter sp. SG61-1L]|uniref:hypothetical protein n=1 Tax=Erythrobacter sp. SG61-1L TaxID=1603897 RepID=UPI0006C91F05|nr:hypothetical protein [Erythrobacter sp. SG61-1L]KPL69539.1 hypothetical protein SZ64_16430 [Erythrobacter sp. SG61-1L]